MFQDDLICAAGSCGRIQKLGHNFTDFSQILLHHINSNASECDYILLCINYEKICCDEHLTHASAKLKSQADKIISTPGGSDAQGQLNYV